VSGSAAAAFLLNVSIKAVFELTGLADAGPA
jgi:hypothetical protein